ncbi:NnrS [Pararhodospirillum photometricum DSM 122]|uniref:NnrS n=1 Tax=Pararhodospirillum photometricum DSM 122 TaxID=1150469 RepID=H6SRC9_PARPM|nr:NnrS family protein [Pararhodospirillum photometricum]CCG07458.1 NnrS [Pararhodospirillum photometricum DSM 122]
MLPPSPLMLFFARAFRPFFLGAGLYAVVVMGLWLLVLQGRLVIPGPFAPLGWHAHEMLFGFAGAAVAGFVLTASPSWTGRPPLRGGHSCFWPSCGWRPAF